MPTEDISLTDIDVDKTSNITEIIEDLFSTGTGTVTGTMTATFAPQEVVSEIISNIEPEATDAVSIETLGPIINVNEDPGVLPGGALAANGIGNIYGSGDIFIHTSLCLLCVFFMSIR